MNLDVQWLKYNYTTNWHMGITSLTPDPKREIILMNLMGRATSLEGSCHSTVQSPLVLVARGYHIVRLCELRTHHSLFSR